MSRANRYTRRLAPARERNVRAVARLLGHGFKPFLRGRVPQSDAQMQLFGYAIANWVPWYVGEK
jgi:hypothetical protein